LNDWAAPADTSAGDWGAPAATSAGDWGTPSQEPAPGQQQPEAEKTDGARRKDRDQEEEDNTLTLDQYLAQQKEKEIAALPKLETRKANEGTENDWDGVTRLEKGEGEAYFSGKTKTVPKVRAEKKEKVFLEIDAHFERPARGGRGRGGDRGEGRSRGGRGRGGRGRGAANGTATGTVNVDDETAFPSLS
jgi:plasminogen activator inhibitor 1 RNA-binding protein